MMKFESQAIVQPSGTKAVLTYPIWEGFDVKTLIQELSEYLKNGRAFADAIAQKESHTFASLVLAGEEFGEEMRRLWGTAMHLSNVLQTDELREECKKGTVLISEYYSDMGQHEGMYRAYVAFKNADEYQTLGSAEKKIIDDTIDDFKRSGVALSPEKKARLKTINTTHAQLTEDFENHLVDAQEVWAKHVVDASVLVGIPNDAIAQMRTKAEEKKLPGYILTLQQPVVFAVLEHADNRQLREEVFVMYNTRASELGPKPELDNGPLIKEILASVDEKAKLLGFANYAELSLDTKMAPSVSEVLAFLERLAAKSKDGASREYNALVQFAAEKLGIAELMPWDIGYVSEKLRLAEYNVSDEELRSYFPSTKVFDGVFGLIGKIYGMRVEEDVNISVWRNGVKFYRVYDALNELRGGFYADLYAREKKRGGAWMDDCIVRRKIGEVVQLPVAYLNCNFIEPKEESDGYLTHAEVETVFHEFGHVLHHVLGTTEYSSVGMMHVEWDAVECPSQVMENWCWDKDMLKSMSSNRETGEVIPDELCDRLIAAKYFQTAMATARQLEFAIVDLELYGKYDPANPREPNEVLSEIRKRIRVTPIYSNDRFLTGFSHIFSGGYGAGYYSYKWAEVLAADVFETYMETGNIFNPGIGARFLTEVLEVGSARPIMESFKAFRGREPSEDALLRQTGLM